MEVLCRWCMKADTCDHADSWAMDSEGMYRGASGMCAGTCPDFEANPDDYEEIIAQYVASSDEEEYQQVSVAVIFDRRYKIEIAILTANELNTQDVLERTRDLREDLQELNDQTLHIGEADITISFMHGTEDAPGDPVGLDEDGNIISLEGAATGENTDSCPICGHQMCGAECPGCGYTAGSWSEEDGTEGQL